MWCLVNLQLTLRILFIYLFCLLHVLNKWPSSGCGVTWLFFFFLFLFAAGLQLPFGSNRSTDPEPGFKQGVRPVSPQSLSVQTEESQVPRLRLLIGKPRNHLGLGSLFSLCDVISERRRLFQSRSSLPFIWPFSYISFILSFSVSFCSSFLVNLETNGCLTSKSILPGYSYFSYVLPSFH